MKVPHDPDPGTASGRAGFVAGALRCWAGEGGAPVKGLPATGGQAYHRLLVATECADAPGKSITVQSSKQRLALGDAIHAMGERKDPAAFYRAYRRACDALDREDRRRGAFLSTQTPS